MIEAWSPLVEKDEGLYRPKWCLKARSQVAVLSKSAEGQAVAGCCAKLENFLSHNCLSQVAADLLCSVNLPYETAFLKYQNKRQFMMDNVRPWVDTGLHLLLQSSYTIEACLDFRR